MRGSKTLYLVSLVMLSMLAASARTVADDNERQHLVLETLFGLFYWQEPDTCVTYRVDVWAQHYRTDGPNTPDVGPLPSPPEGVALTAGFTVFDSCHSVMLDYVGNSTN